MRDYQRDVERGHSFDGLSEYDNRVPLWLHAMFILTVIWSVWYVGWYLLGEGEIGVEAYESERIAILEAKAAGPGIPDEETLRQFSHIEDRVEKGREVFFGAGMCTSCHGQDGLGLAGVGPNLRDDRWIYGSDMSAIVETLQNGRGGGIMPPATMLSEQQVINLAAYLAHWNRSAKANGQGFVKDTGKPDPITY